MRDRRAAGFSIEATVCFWTTEATEVLNAFTYGGATITQYPLNIFPREVMFHGQAVAWVLAESLEAARLGADRAAQGISIGGLLCAIQAGRSRALEIAVLVSQVMVMLSSTSSRETPSASPSKTRAIIR